MSFVHSYRVYTPTHSLLFTHVAMVVYRSQFNSAVIRIDSEVRARVQHEWIVRD